MIFVAIGGFLGAIARFSLSEWMKKQLHRPGFIATFSINCVGSFFLGLCFGFGMEGEFFSLVGIGFLGAFTTFSTFSYEVVQLIESQKYRIAFLYLLGSLMIGILMATAGFCIHYL